MSEKSRPITFMCRQCGFTMSSAKIFSVSIAKYVDGKKCIKCNATGSDEFPVTCMIIDPAIKKIEQIKLSFSPKEYEP